MSLRISPTSRRSSRTVYGRRRVAVALLLPLSLLPAPVWSQSPAETPFWAGLDPGPHAVGFRSYWKRDWSRSWLPNVDTAGRPTGAVSGRPVRINVWYPARVGGIPAMRFGDYLGSATTPGFATEEKMIRDEDFGSLGGGGMRNLLRSDSSYRRLTQTITAAHRNAPAERGKFPVVVYALGQGDYTMENTPLCEYLASRGLIVVSVAQIGTSPRRNLLFIHDPASYDAEVRDLAFALQTVIADPMADSSRIAAVGHSMGGTYALMLAVRHTGVHTVIGLDPSYVSPQPSYVYKFSEAADFDPARFRGNLVALYRAEINPRTTIVDSLRYANRILLPIPMSIHADFNGFPIYTSRGAPAEVDSFAIAHRTQAQAVQTFNAVTRYVGCYLSASLANQSTASCPIPPGAVAERLSAATTPTEEELFDALHERGLTAAENLARATAARSPLVLRRSVMERIANEQGYAGRPREAAEYAQLITIVFPDAAAFERAGDEWSNVGESARARAAYEASLRLEPDRAGVKEKLARIIRT